MENAIQGKYGWYPCDRETYLKLKFLYKKYQENLQYSAKWYRCHRKAEKNRKKKVDKVENLFLRYYPNQCGIIRHISEINFDKNWKDIKWNSKCCFDSNGKFILYSMNDNHTETLFFNGNNIQTMYKNCKPVKNKEDVKQIDCKLIHELYEKLK